MIDLKFNLQVYLGELGRLRHQVLLGAIVGTLVASVGAAMVPDRYRSEALLYIDTDALLAQVLQTSAVLPATGRQAETVRLLMYSRPNIEKAIRSADLDLKIHDAASREDLVNAVTAALRVDATGPDTYRISYAHNRPREAQKIVQSVLETFIETNLKSMSLESDNSVAYTKARYEKVVADLGAAQRELAAFRAQHPEELQGEGVLLNEVRRLDELLARGPGDLRSMDAQIAQTAAALQATSRVIPGVPGAGGGGCDAAMLQAQYGANVARGLTDAHPDMQMLKSQMIECRKVPERVLGGGGVNPLYADQQARLANLRNDRQRLSEQLRTAEVERARARRMLATQPALAEQLRVLQTRVDGLFVAERAADADVKRVQETVNSHQQATLVRYRIAQAPTLPIKPEAPNRPALFFGALLFGLAASVGATVLRMQIAGRIPSLQHLRAAVDLPVLGGISDFYARRPALNLLRQGFFGIGVGVLLSMPLVCTTFFPLIRR